MISTPDLPDDIATLKALLVARDDRIDRLEKLVAEFKRALFGKRSERLDPEQMELAFEDIEAAIAVVEAEGEDQDFVQAKPKPSSKPRPLPQHLPRIETVVEPESTTCDCGAKRHVIGEDVSERLDIIPAQFRVLVTRRPRYACRSCEAGVVQVPAPVHLIEAGLPTEATLATIIVSKHADHLPLFRQSQIYARQGVEIERSTLAGWLGRAAYALRPISEALLANLRQSTKLFMDETTVPVLDPGRGRTKTGYFWALARDDRTWAGPEPPAVAFTYAPGRSGKYASEILGPFEGTLQVDGYTGYNRLRDARHDGDIQLAYCWAHARRKLYELTVNNVAPIAEDGLKQIAALYRIESRIRGLSAEERGAARQDASAPKVAAFHVWLAAARSQVSAKSPTGEALKYIARYWDGLTLFLEDGRVEMDSNPVERTIRAIALNRKNALFAGHDEGARNWATCATLIETCKLNKIEPHAYLTGVLTAIARGHKQRDIEKLLPWNFQVA